MPFRLCTCSALLVQVKHAKIWTLLVVFCTLSPGWVKNLLKTYYIIQIYILTDENLCTSDFDTNYTVSAEDLVFAIAFFLHH